MTSFVLDSIEDTLCFNDDSNGHIALPVEGSGEGIRHMRIRARVS